MRVAESGFPVCVTVQAGPEDVDAIALVVDAVLAVGGVLTARLWLGMGVSRVVDVDCGVGEPENVLPVRTAVLTLGCGLDNVVVSGDVCLRVPRVVATCVRLGSDVSHRLIPRYSQADKRASGSLRIRSTGAR